MYIFSDREYFYIHSARPIVEKMNYIRIVLDGMSPKENVTIFQLNLEIANEHDNTYIRQSYYTR